MIEPRRPPLSPALPGTQPPPYRSSERGAALVIVLMVITLLTGIGIFAARNASLVSLDAGYSRRAAQTLYLTEFAVQVATRNIMGKETAKADDIKSPARGGQCRDNYPLLRDAPGKQVTCMRTNLSTLRQDGTSTYAADQDYVGRLSRSQLANMEGSFEVELTEYGDAPEPVTGSELDGVRQSFKYKQVTWTAMGRVAPESPAGNTTCDKDVAVGTVVKKVRGRLTFGPIFL